MSELGKGLQVAGFALRGPTDVSSTNTLIDRVTERLGMHQPYDRVLCDYPTSWGTGGLGITTFQPITESFIAVDSWIEHKGVYLIVCSCVPFDLREVFTVIGNSSYSLIDYFNRPLCLMGPEVG